MREGSLLVVCDVVCVARCDVVCDLCLVLVCDLLWTEYSWVCPKFDRVSNVVVVCVTVFCPVKGSFVETVCPGLERLGVSVLWSV